MNLRNWLIAQIDKRGCILKTRIADDLDLLSLPGNFVVISEWTIVDELRTVGAI